MKINKVTLKKVLKSDHTLLAVMALGLLLIALISFTMPTPTETMKTVSTQAATNGTVAAASTGTVNADSDTADTDVQVSQTTSAARSSVTDGQTLPVAQKTGIAYGTPHLTYSYHLAYVDKDPNTCHFNVTVNVSVDNWQGYSTGKIVVNMVLHSLVLGDFPYSTSYALSPGETKTFAHDFYIPTVPTGDDFRATATASPIDGALGDTMLVTNATPISEADNSLNCF